MPVALRGRGTRPLAISASSASRPHAQAPHERIGGAAVAQHPGVAALARGDRRGGQLAPEAQPAAPERDLEMRAAG